MRLVWNIYYDSSIVSASGFSPTSNTIHVSAVSPGFSYIQIETCYPTGTGFFCQLSSPGNVTVLERPRDLGDFDESGCTTIGDFLILLDYWNEPYNGIVMDADDF